MTNPVTRTIAMFLTMAIVWAFAQHGVMAAGSTKVLVVGNSYVLRNDLPALILDYANSQHGGTVSTEVVGHEGYSLAQHLEDPAFGARIASCDWDLLVLQDRAAFPSHWTMNGIAAHGFPEDSISSVGKIVDFATPCKGKIALLQVWDRSPDGQRYTDYDTAVVSSRYNLGIIPVGDYFRLSQDREPSVVLFDKDGFHPSRRGSVLIAALNI